MASLIMHIAVSKIVAEKFNFSNKFMAGCIIPDISAKCGIERNITHYIDSQNTDLPNYEKFIKKYKKNISDELILGYLAHLIEDYVWIEEFASKYAKRVSYNSEKVNYLTDNSIHSKTEFFTELYKDYNYIDNYICEKYNIFLETFKYEILKFFNKNIYRDKINEYICIRKIDLKRNNVFLTKQDTDNFIEISSNQVINIIKELNRKDF